MNTDNPTRTCLKKVVVNSMRDFKRVELTSGLWERKENTRKESYLCEWNRYYHERICWKPFTG
jgi:hypothetical protein